MSCRRHETSVTTLPIFPSLFNGDLYLGASDGTITDFGAALSVFFRDPDGLEAEVVWNKDPETRAAERRPA